MPSPFRSLAALVLAGLLATLAGRCCCARSAASSRRSARSASRLAQLIGIDGPGDLRKLGERLDWLRLRLAELEADRGKRVLRHVSHELKTPLASPARRRRPADFDGVLGPLAPGNAR